jgi:hypothetical protein
LRRGVVFQPFHPAPPPSPPRHSLVGRSPGHTTPPAGAPLPFPVDGGRHRDPKNRRLVPPIESGHPSPICAIHFSRGVRFLSPSTGETEARRPCV